MTDPDSAAGVEPPSNWYHWRGMKIMLEPTTKIVEIDGVPARIWEGTTNHGIAIHAFVTRIAAERLQDLSELEQALSEQRPPVNPDIESYPAGLALGGTSCPHVVTSSEGTQYCTLAERTAAEAGT